MTMQSKHLILVCSRTGLEVLRWLESAGVRTIAEVSQLSPAELRALADEGRARSLAA